MTNYTTPKTDWTSSDGVSYTDLNRIEEDIVYLKETTDDTVADLETHAEDATIHKTSEAIRVESGTAFVNEVRTSDPASPAIGRMWLNTTV